MKKSPLQLGVVVAFCCLMSATTALAKSSLGARDLLQMLGFDTFVESFAEALRTTDSQFAEADTGLALAWDLAADEVFPAPEVFDEIVTSMEGRLTEDQMAKARDFLLSDLGVLVTEMEVEAQKPGMSGEVNEQGTEILTNLIASDPARLQKFKDMIEALGAIETEVASAMNLNFAIYSGMSQSGKLPYELNEAEILDLVASQQDAIRSHIQDQIYITFAYTYRDLSDDQLSRYIDFLTSEAGRALYAAINLTTEDVISQRAKRFGTRLMELQGVQEL